MALAVLIFSNGFVFNVIEMINNKARQILINAKYRRRSDWLDGAVNFWEPLGQTKVMQIRQRETQNHQGAVTHEVCCLAAQLFGGSMSKVVECRPVQTHPDCSYSQPLIRNCQKQI